MMNRKISIPGHPLKTLQPEAFGNGIFTTITLSAPPTTPACPVYKMVLSVRYDFTVGYHDQGGITPIPSKKTFHTRGEGGQWNGTLRLHGYEVSPPWWEGIVAQRY